MPNDGVRISLCPQGRDHIEPTGLGSRCVHPKEEPNHGNSKGEGKQRGASVQPSQSAFGSRKFRQEGFGHRRQAIRLLIEIALRLIRQP